VSYVFRFDTSHTRLLGSAPAPNVHFQGALAAGFLAADVVPMYNIRKLAETLGVAPSSLVDGDRWLWTGAGAPLTADDAIWSIVGLGDTREPTNMAEDIAADAR